MTTVLPPALPLPSRRDRLADLHTLCVLYSETLASLQPYWKQAEANGLSSIRQRRDYLAGLAKVAVASGLLPAFRAFVDAELDATATKLDVGDFAEWLREQEGLPVPAGWVEHVTKATRSPPAVLPADPLPPGAVVVWGGDQAVGVFPSNEAPDLAEASPVPKRRRRNTTDITLEMAGLIRKSPALADDPAAMLAALENRAGTVRSCVVIANGALCWRRVTTGKVSRLTLKSVREMLSTIRGWEAT